MLTKNVGESSQVSLSSVSDYQSDDSEDKIRRMERKTSLQELVRIVEDKRALFHQKGRSKSDGEARILKNDYKAFPSLSNSVLEELGLQGDGPNELMNEEELEQRFTSLALAFTIDSTTIKDRCERQRRSRNQTETNLNVEVKKLREKVSLMQPFCTDYEKAELFSTIMTQIDIIMNAATLATISAERFGSVQQEDRLTESVRLMVNYVQSLKQQKEATKKQLQYTKRVLQNSADSPRGLSLSPTNNHLTLSSPNVKIISKRRASIASISQQVKENNPSRSILEFKKITRRTSDLSLVSGSLIRRPTRLDLGGELTKIKENNAELINENDVSSDVENEETHQSTPNVSSPEEEIMKEIDSSTLSFSEQVIYKCKTFKQSIIDRLNNLTSESNFHNIFIFCALLCLSIGLWSLINVFTEYEYAKRGILWWTSEGNN